MSGPVLEVALVGAGGTATAHARAIAGSGGAVRIVAAVEPVPSRLRAFGERWGVPNLYYDLPTLLELERPAVVHLCSPPALHREHALICLAHEPVVLCDHPTQLTLADLDAIAAAGGTARFAAAFPDRFGPPDDRRAGLVAQFAAVHAALLRGTPPPVTFAETRSTVERLAAAP
jgi:predicted dehydrogenase